MAKFDEMVMQGTRASQPSAGIPGRLYYVTDEEKFEYDNGLSWSEWTNGLGVTWAESTTTDGENQNRSTAGTFTSQSGVFQLFRPLKITKVSIDVRIASTYDLYISDGSLLNPIYMITEGKVVSAGGKIDFYPDDGEFILHQGTHVITLEAASSVLWWDCDSSVRINALFIEDWIFYETTVYASYCMPLGFTAYEGTYTRGTTWDEFNVIKTISMQPRGESITENGDFWTSHTGTGGTAIKHYNIAVPNDFHTLISVEIALLATELNTNQYLTVNTDWATDGEVYNSGSDSCTTATKTISNNTIGVFDITDAFDGIAAGDFVGVSFAKGVNAGIRDVGLRFTYI